jgi:hypothetical protein
MQEKASPALFGCFGLIGIVVLIGVFSSGGGNNSTSPSSSSSSIPSASAVPKNSAPETKPEPGSQWSYSGGEDKMGRKRLFASVTSTNALNFAFPYHGNQKGVLTIRKSESGTNVLLRIERGQFLCGLEECTVNVRFDSGPIQRLSASGPDDHGTTTLFLNNEGRFVSQLRNAKAVRIEAKFYQEGSEAFEFDVEGFKWN